MGRGVYPIRDCPLPPAHPHCRCYVTHRVTEDADAVVDALRLRYGLVDDEPLVMTPSRFGALRLVERAIDAALRLIGLREAA
jgi:hypothetical protein